MTATARGIDTQLSAVIQAKLQRDWPDGLDLDELFIGPVVTRAEGGAWTHVCMEVFVPLPLGAASNTPASGAGEPRSNRGGATS